MHNAAAECTLMHIPAKPGYGKTILCSTIIERLGQYAISSDSNSEDLLASVFFYFFDKRRGNRNYSGDALRAVLAQLIYLHRHNRRVLDTATAIYYNSATGQGKATENEITRALESLLQSLEVSFLVFDGLDECSDYPVFLRRIDEIASKPGLSCVLLSSRPNVQLPTCISRDCLVVYLTSLENASDIERYLLPEVEELIKTGVLPLQQSAEEIVGQILPRSNGMFLWVRLLVEYLRLPVLTPRERNDAILHLNRLEGLDKL